MANKNSPHPPSATGREKHLNHSLKASTLSYHFLKVEVIQIWSLAKFQLAYLRERNREWELENARERHRQQTGSVMWRLNVWTTWRKHESQGECSRGAAAKGKRGKVTDASSTKDRITISTWETEENICWIKNLFFYI